MTQPLICSCGLLKVRKAGTHVVDGHEVWLRRRARTRARRSGCRRNATGMIGPRRSSASRSPTTRGDAPARGYEITGWLEGIDESGSRARSAWWPRLDQAVAAVETGEYDVILVWKYSRVARHRLRWAVAIDRVEDAGGRLESATEQFDTTTSSGRLARGMLAELQAFEAERIGEVWKDVHKSRVPPGSRPTGKPKWGYVYDRREAARARPRDRARARRPLPPLRRRRVRLRLVRWLNAHGWRTLDRRPWSDRSLRRVLDSGFASGRFRLPRRAAPGVHEPLIDDQLWQAYLDARAQRRGRPAARAIGPVPALGLVRCGRCGGPMVAGQFGNAASRSTGARPARRRAPRSAPAAT
jgi:site-specific DNA recombinase